MRLDPEAQVNVGRNFRNTGSYDNTQKSPKSRQSLTTAPTTRKPPKSRWHDILWGKILVGLGIALVSGLIFFFFGLR
jgi:hypothetical protein